MNDHPKVSVIMPVYNSEKYVRAAADSLLAQDYRNFELLLIDDGSTDSSGGLVDAVAQEDGRVRVIHKENGGMCQTRNFGMEIARGEYIMFCDNDDVCLPGFIGDNVAIAEKTGADCVRFGRTIRRISADGDVLRETPGSPPGRKLLSNFDMLRCYRYYYYYGSGAVWTGLFRRSAIEWGGVRFDERLRNGFEDTLFVDRFYNVARTTAFNPKIYYLWQRREGHSSSMAISENQLFGLKLVLDLECELFDKWELSKMAPGFCSQRLVSHCKDLLTAGHYKSEVSFERQLELYRRLHEIYSPYAEQIEAGRIDFQFRMIRDCILQERYRMLYGFISTGVAVKRRAGA